LIIDEFSDHDRARRGGAHPVVRSIVSGSTVVGLLARLVQQVDPDEIAVGEPTSPDAARDPSLSPITAAWPESGLVVDEAALAIPERDRSSTMAAGT
jgi:hypothetical protein